jgi:hypothetical protein
MAEEKIDWEKFYIDQSDAVILFSLQKPRRIVLEEDLEDIRLLSSQELTTTGLTMAHSLDKNYSIPTASLTEYGMVVVNYTKSRMSQEDKTEMNHLVESYLERMRQVDQRTFSPQNRGEYTLVAA